MSKDKPKWHKKWEDIQTSKGTEFYMLYYHCLRALQGLIIAIEEEESISLSNKTLVHIYRINRKIIQMSEHYKALIKKHDI